MGELIEAGFGKTKSFPCIECGRDALENFKFEVDIDSENDIVVTAICQHCSTSYVRCFDFEEMERE